MWKRVVAFEVKRANDITCISQQRVTQRGTQAVLRDGGVMPALVCALGAQPGGKGLSDLVGGFAEALHYQFMVKRGPITLHMSD